ncbi:MAG: TetR/AcrR family transcriptional regulator [Planctomycetes bacterium]|nr:TetR/AcrR family transcriptional regulator [Planctomycetota bacterium]
MKAESKSRKALERRLEIARAAAAVFRRKGFAAATTEDIAGALGMTKGSLYYYFRDKPDILWFCQNYSLDRMLADAARIRRSGAPPAARLRDLVRSQMALMLDELAGTAAHIQTDALDRSRWRKLVAKRDRYEGELRSIVADGVRRRDFRAVDPATAARAILGAVNWTITWFRPGGKRRSDEVAADFAELFVEGLRSRK